jgi:hypothetical protein
MRAFVAIFIACFGLLGSVQGQHLSYFMRVFGGIQVSGLRVYGGNCYNKVRAEVMDIGAVPMLPPQQANCP